MKRLYRSRSEEMVAGVCGGIAEYFAIDPTLVRLAFALLALTGGGGVWIYLILWIVVPLEPLAASEPLRVEAKAARDMEEDSAPVHMVEESQPQKPKKASAPKPAAAEKPQAPKKTGQPGG